MRAQALMALVAAAGFAAASQAQPFKCTGPDGKVVYSDQRCEARPAAAKAAQPAAKAKGGGRYEPTAEEEKRIEALEAAASRKGANAEQKSAALLEVSSIRSGQDARMSAEHRGKRDALVAELAAADAKKRAAAMRALRDLYSAQ